MCQTFLDHNLSSTDHLLLPSTDLALNIKPAFISWKTWRRKRFWHTFGRSKLVVVVELPQPIGSISLPQSIGWISWCSMDTTLTGQPWFDDNDYSVPTTYPWLVNHCWSPIIGPSLFVIHKRTNTIGQTRLNCRDRSVTIFSHDFSVVIA